MTGRTTMRSRVVSLLISFTLLLGAFQTIPIVFPNFGADKANAAGSSDFALNFNSNTTTLVGANQKQVIPPNSTDDYTLETWVYVDSNTGGWQSIAVQDQSQNSDSTLTGASRFFFGFDSAMKIHVGLGGGYLPFTPPEYSFPVGEWKHVVLTVGQGTDNINVYVDGVNRLKGTLARVSTTALRGFTIGTASDGGFEIDGSIDQMKVWSGILTPEQMQQSKYVTSNVGVTGSPPALRAYYDFNHPIATPSITDRATGNLYGLTFTAGSATFPESTRPMPISLKYTPPGTQSQPLNGSSIVGIRCSSDSTTSANTVDQDASQACDEGTATKFFSNDTTSKLRIRLDSAYKVTAISFVGANDDSTYILRKIASAGVYGCATSTTPAASCTLVATVSWSKTELDSYGNYGAYATKDFSNNVAFQNYYILTNSYGEANNIASNFSASVKSGCPYNFNTQYCIQYSEINLYGTKVTSSDSTKPASSITSPAASPITYVNSFSASVGYSASDETELLSIQVYRSNTSTLTAPTVCGSLTISGGTSSSGTLSCALNGLTGGVIYVYTVATDLAGNTEDKPTTADSSFLMDTTAPTSSLAAQAARKSNVVVSPLYNASDSGSGLSTVALYYSLNSSLSSPVLCFTINITTNPTTSRSFVSSGETCTLPTPDGQYYMYTIATDIAGNVEAKPSTADTIIKIDNVAPTVSVATGTVSGNTVNVTKSENLAYGSNTISLTFSEAASTLTLTGADSSLFSFACFTGQTTCSFGMTNAPNFENPLDSNGDNFYEITVNFGDSAGNTTSQNISVAIANVPEITQVTSSTPNGTYGSGTLIPIQVTFDTAVTVTAGTGGAWRILIRNTSTSTATAFYASGSGTDTLTFNYSVLDNDLSSDLDYTASNSLGHTGTGGLIRSSSSVGASLTLPAPAATGSLSSNKDIVVEGVPPTLTLLSASSITGIGATLNFTSNDSGNYYFLVKPSADAAPTNTVVVAQGTASAKGTGSLIASANSVSFTGLSGATSYKAYVVAVDSLGNKSAVSTINTFTTLASETIKPESSGSITATITTGNSAIVSYSASDSGGLAGIAVYYSSSSTLSSPVICGSASISTTSATGNLTCTLPSTDATYFVYTVATDAAGNIEDAPTSGNADDSIIRDSSAPTITGPSGSAGSATSVKAIPENSTAIATISVNETVTWSLSGVDAGVFTIGTTGVLTVSSRNYELPSDNGGDNSYVVIINATDTAGNTSSQTLTVTITDVDEVAPIITGPSAAAGSTTSVKSIPENSTAAATISANETVAWSLSGTDVGVFAINSSGVLTISSRNYEAPTDTGSDNTYLVIITATDAAGNTSTQTLTVTITDVDEIAPTLSLVTVSSVTSSGINLNYSTNESGTYYYLIYSASDSAPLSSVIIAQGNAINKASSAANTGSNSISVISLSDSTAFKAYLVVQDITGNTSEVSTVSFNTLPNAPTITSFVASITGTTSVDYGDTVTITGTNFSSATSVSIGGTAVSSFSVVSPTSITFTSNKACCSAGKVSVTTNGGTVTSSADLIPLVQIPVITSQPSPSTATRKVGESVTFSISVAASLDGGSLSYQWKKGTSNIANTDSSSYTFNTAAVSDGGSYSVVVTNKVGASTAFVASSGATLTMNKGDQVALTITSGSPVFGSTFTLATSGGTTGGSVAFTTSTPGCSISASPPFTLSSNAAQICAVTATMAENTDYNIVTSASTNIAFSKANQAGLSITASVNSAIYSGTAFTATPTLLATGGTGTGVPTFAVSGGTATGCALSNSTSSAILTATSSGTCLIAATNPGDGNYNPVTSSNLTFTILPNNDATLGTFVLTNFTLSPTFISSISSYTSTVLASSSSVSISATPTVATSTMQYKVGSGSFATLTSGVTIANIPLNYGDNSLAVRVTAQDGTLQNYEFLVTRPSSASTILIALTGGATSGTYNAPVNIIATTTNVAGKVNFKVGGASITGCAQKDVSNGTATCAWTPAAANASTVLTAVFTPTDSVANSPGTSADLTINVQKATRPNLVVTTNGGTYGTTTSLASTGTIGVGLLTYETATPGCTVSGGSITATKAMTCSVTVTQAANSDYEETTSPAKDVVIHPKAVTITAQNNGTTFTGSPAVFTNSYSAPPQSLIGNDAISNVAYEYEGTGATVYSRTSTVPTNAGTYAIIPATITMSGTQADSYIITRANGTLTIAKRNLAQPNAPNVIATAGVLKNLAVTWTAVTNSAAYALKIYASDGTTLLQTVSGLSGTSKTITATEFTTIVDNTGYKVGVIATGDSNNSDSVVSALSSLVTTNNSYSITYNSNSSTDGSVPSASSWVTGASASLVSANTGALSRTGYTFEGWNSSDSGNGTNYAATGSATYSTAANLVLYAKWSKDTYFIEYASQGGSLVLSTSYQIGDTATLAAGPSRAGYNFAGWATTQNGTSVGATYSPSGIGTVTLYALWTAINYRVYYSSNSGDSGTVPSNTTNYNIGGTVTVVGNTSNVGLTGYTWGGWNTAANGLGTTYQAAATFAIGAGDVTLYAKWNAINYSVTYSAIGINSGSVPTETASYNIGQTAPILGSNGIKKTGYSFAGWTVASDGTGTVLNSGSGLVVGSNNIILYAKWEALTYAVTYSANGASGSPSVTSATYTTGGTVITLPTQNTMAKDGHTFSGWATSSNGTLLTSPFTTSSDVNLVAVWTAIPYTITYIPNGGSSTPTQANLTIGQTLTLANAISRSSSGGISYQFAGWDSGSSIYQAGTTLPIQSSNLSFTAVWVQLYEVTYVASGGSLAGSDGENDSECSSQLCTNGQPITLNGTPTKDGYSFDGWKDQLGNLVADSNSGAAGTQTTVTANRFIFTASWTAVNYTITYASTGSTPPTQAHLTMGQSFIVATAVTKPGHSFSGWSDGTNVLQPGALVVVGTNNLIYTAQWTADIYMVIYDLNGGTGSAISSVSYTYGTSEITLPLVGNRTRTNYTFGGWSTTNNGVTVGLTYTPTVSATLYAVWSLNQYTVTFNGNAVNVSNTTALYTAGSTALALPTVTRAGFIFKGWYSASTTGSLIGLSGASYVPAATGSIYARWTQLSLSGVDENSLTKVTESTALTASPVNQTFSSTDGSTSVTIPAGSLPEGTIVTYYLLASNPTRVIALPAGTSYVLSLVVSWVALDGTVPLTATNKPIEVVVSSSSIKKGASIYAIVGESVKFLGIATQDGSVTALITEDPEIIVVKTKPGAPTNVSGTNGADASSVISWTAPSSNGGSAIANYTVEDNNGSVRCTTSLLTCAVSGLTNGTTYTFKVKATNAIGTSDLSLPSSGITPISAAPVVPPVTAPTTPPVTAPTTPPVTPTPTAPEPVYVTPAFETANFARSVVFGDTKFELPGKTTVGTTLKWGTNSSTCSVTSAGVITWKSTGTCVLIASNGATEISYGIQIDPRTEVVVQEITQVQSSNVLINATVKWPGQTFDLRFCVGKSTNKCLFNKVISINSLEGQTLTADGDLYITTTISGLSPRSEYDVFATVIATNKSLASNVRSIKTPAGIAASVSGATTITLGQELGLTIEATGEGSVISLRAVGLPTGVSVTRTANGGTITGKPRATGVYFVTVKLTDSFRQITDLPVTIIVNQTASVAAIVNGAIYKPTSAKTTLVSWKNISAVKQIQVKLGSTVVCTTSSTSCVVKQLLGPKSTLQILATNPQGAVANPVLPIYVAPKKLVEVGTTNFATNVTSLTAAQKKALNKVAADMEVKGFTQLTVYGYTDQTGSKTTNDKISLARATAIYTYLKALLAEKQLTVTLIGKGFKDPVATNATAKGRAANRRAVVSIG